MSIHVLMEVPVHNMGTMLPALAQWDILEFCVKVYIYIYIWMSGNMESCTTVARNIKAPLLQYTMKTTNHIHHRMQYLIKTALTGNNI